MNYDSILVHRKLDSVSLAIAECSQVDMPEVIKLLESYGFYTKRALFYFNRLHVPHNYRQQGIGSDMLREMLELVVRYDVTLINEVNGSEVDYDTLIKFYEKHEFIHVAHNLYVFNALKMNLH
ncbi:hypothetical protein [Ralstonia phage RP13]|nr:hypothetical protein [Ralstonia phage RP13]